MMSAEISLNLSVNVTNPSTGNTGAMSVAINPGQLSITQNAQGRYADVISISAPSANTTYQGYINKPSAVAATTTTLPANTYNNGSSGVGATLTGNANGALSAVDGITLALNQTLLVKNEATGANNGLYKLTTVGDGSNPYVLTRSTAQDTTDEFVGTTIYVESGTVNGGKVYNVTNTSAPTVGSTTITYQESIAGTVIGSGNLTTLGIMYIQNLDSTNYAIIGPSVGGYLQPFAKVKATENYVVRLYPGVVWRAVTELAMACKLNVDIQND